MFIRDSANAFIIHSMMTSYFFGFLFIRDDVIIVNELLALRFYYLRFDGTVSSFLISFYDMCHQMLRIKAIALSSSYCHYKRIHTWCMTRP